MADRRGCKLALGCREDWITYLQLVVIAIMIRCMVGMFPYSGEGNAPRFGDYEAQRHWMEVTRGKERFQWYRYDLEYWGLDYPPLSAFHAYLTSFWVESVDPAAIALDTSRGYESAATRTAMRTSVVFWDVLVFFPAAWFLATSMYGRGPKQNRLYLFSALVFCPALLLIDHGHFQYNGVSLGFFLIAFAFVWNENDEIGAIFFALSVNFKHMSLYFLPAFAAYTLGRSRQRGIGHLLRVSLCAVVTTCLLWLPIPPRAVFGRMFPVGRGLYEDKVANLWCTVSPLIKLRNHLRHDQLVLITAITTLLSVLPSCVAIIIKPTPQRLLPGLATISLSCYLFGYQVHEKQILLPLIAVTMSVVEAPSFSTLFSVVACVSMYPLLEKEGLHVPFLVLLSLQLLLIGRLTPPIADQRGRRTLAGAIVLVCLMHTVRLIGPTLSTLPDLYDLFFTATCCAALGIYLLTLNATVFQA